MAKIKTVTLNEYLHAFLCYFERKLELTR